MSIVRCLLVTFALCLPATAQEDAKVPSQELRAGGDEDKRFFLLGPLAGAGEPERGFGLVVVLPGGDGSEELLRFVKRIHLQAAGPEHLVADLVAPKWTDEQQIVWPTDKNRVAKQKFTTEE